MPYIDPMGNLTVLTNYHYHGYHLQVPGLCRSSCHPDRPFSCSLRQGGLRFATASWFQDAIWDVEILGDSHVHIESYWYLMILRRFAILLGSRFGAILNIEASISMQLTLFAQLLLILVLVWSLIIAYKCNFGNSVVEHLPFATIFWDLEKKWKNTTSEQRSLSTSDLLLQHCWSLDAISA